MWCNPQKRPHLAPSFPTGFCHSRAVKGMRDAMLKHGTCLVLQIYMYLWAQPPSHQVLMRLCIQLQCLAWQMVLGWIWIIPLRLVCLSNVQTRVLLAWLSLLQEPHQGPIHNKTSLAVGWGLQLCLKFRWRPSGSLENMMRMCSRCGLEDLVAFQTSFDSQNSPWLLLVLTWRRH